MSSDILGTSSSIFTVTFIALAALGINPERARLAALVTSIFLTVTASSLVFSYLGLPLLATYQFILLGIGAYVEFSIAAGAAMWLTDKQ